MGVWSTPGYCLSSHASILGLNATKDNEKQAPSTKQMDAIEIAHSCSAWVDSCAAKQDCLFE